MTMATLLKTRKIWFIMINDHQWGAFSKLLDKELTGFGFHFPWSSKPLGGEQLCPQWLQTAHNLPKDCLTPNQSDCPQVLWGSSVLFTKRESDKVRASHWWNLPFNSVSKRTWAQAHLWERCCEALSDPFLPTSPVCTKK